MCKFEDSDESMTFENCNLFKRSFTTQGLGFTFNNEEESRLIKEDFRSKLSVNVNRKPYLMKSKHSLTVVIENNAEEVEKYENSPFKRFVKKPSELFVSLHNPKEPADLKFIPSTSIRIPRGYSTTFLITPKAREIDKSGKELTESQRNCRLEEEVEALDTFNVYTMTACLLECKMKYATKRCGCTPWNYPVKMENKVSIICKV